MPRPNILWITTDQQRFDTLGLTGNRSIRTPNIDRLGRDGMVFTHAYCQAPICTPSRAAFLTGMYPSTVHACMNGNERWDEAAPLVTKLLKDEGYRCGLSGKLHLAGAYGRVEPRPSDDGYDFFRWSHHSTDGWDEGHDYATWVRSQGHDPGELLQRIGYFPAELHQTTWCFSEAMRFIDESVEAQPDTPWLMSINCFDPHPPFDPPADYLSRYDPDSLPGPHFEQNDLAAQALLSDIDFQSVPRDPSEFDIQSKIAAYYAMIELVDDNVGRIVTFLEERGLRENTIVIFMSDHGESLGDHGLLLKGCRFYEGLVRVPLMISGPGIGTGGVSDALVELVDLTPTLLQAADLQPTPRMAGVSLLPMLHGETPADHHRDSVRSEYYHTLGRIEGGKPARGSYATMIRDSRYKVVTYHGSELGELFDLDADPWEHHNLWNDEAHRDTRFRLLKKSFDQTAFAVDTGPEQLYRY